jgi:hypothetical protein
MALVKVVRSERIQKVINFKSGFRFFDRNHIDAQVKMLERASVVGIRIPSN